MDGKRQDWEVYKDLFTEALEAQFATQRILEQLVTAVDKQNAPSGFSAIGDWLNTPAGLRVLTTMMAISLTAWGIDLPSIISFIVEVAK